MVKTKETGGGGGVIYLPPEKKFHGNRWDGL